MISSKGIVVCSSVAVFCSEVVVEIVSNVMICSKVVAAVVGSCVDVVRTLEKK